jgi:hypothetical protein
MNDALPEPTRREAFALIVGTGTFWALWALAVGGVVVGLPLFGAAIIPGLIVGAWLYFGGVYSIAARSLGQTVGQWYFAPFSRGWTKTFKDRSGRGWWRVLMPAYYRRAARVLGWNETAVLVVLGALLLLDLALFIPFWTAGPSSNHS